MGLFLTRRSFIVLGASAVAASITGTVAETSLAAVTVPAGAMGANGDMRFTALFSYTNSCLLYTSDAADE